MERGVENAKNRRRDRRFVKPVILIARESAREFVSASKQRLKGRDGERLKLILRVRVSRVQQLLIKGSNSSLDGHHNEA